MKLSHPKAQTKGGEHLFSGPRVKKSKSQEPLDTLLAIWHSKGHPQTTRSRFTSNKSFGKTISTPSVRLVSLPLGSACFALPTSFELRIELKPQSTTCADRIPSCGDLWSPHAVFFVDWLCCEGRHFVQTPWPQVWIRTTHRSTLHCSVWEDTDYHKAQGPPTPSKLM